MLTNDNQSLIHKPLQDRRLVLYNHFHEVSGEIQFATHMEGNDTEQIQAFLLESVNHGCEGLMVKTLTENATYEPSKRSLNWLKVGFCWNSENSLKKISSKSQGIRWISCQLGDIMEKVKLEFDAAGIDIPFNQLDINFPEKAVEIIEQNSANK